MNVLNYYTKIYGYLHNYKLLPYWFLTPLRWIVRGKANKAIPKYLDQTFYPQTQGNSGIIVSLTSFPARINNVWMVIESIKNQSVKPEKILLWLSKEQFLSDNDIPNSLRNRQDGVFEIRMVKEDIRSYKKYFYTMQEYPEKVVVTIDDDIIYHPQMLANLVNASTSNPGAIVANISKTMQFDNDGMLMPYSKWKRTPRPDRSKNNVQIGCGGVLYPPGSLHKLALDKEKFLSLAPMADDLWLNMAARLNDTPVIQASREILPLPIQSKAPKLSNINVGKENLNDKQIVKIREYLKTHGYKNIYVR